MQQQLMNGRSTYDEGVEYALDDPIKMYDDLMDACRYGYCTRKIRNLI